MDPGPPTAPDNLLVGADEIGTYLRRNRRQTFYLLERKLIPGFKIGRRWHARKSTLEAFLIAQEQAAQEQAAKARPRTGQRRGTTGPSERRAC